MKKFETLQSHKKKLFKTNPEFKKEYYSYDLAFEIGQMLIETRSIKGLTQKKLAEIIKTKQSGIARAENGKSLPSLSFLNKIAKALHTYLVVRFGFMDKYEISKISPKTSFDVVFRHNYSSDKISDCLYPYNIEQSSLSSKNQFKFIHAYS